MSFTHPGEATPYVVALLTAYHTGDPEGFAVAVKSIDRLDRLELHLVAMSLAGMVVAYGRMIEDVTGTPFATLLQRFALNTALDTP